MADEVIGELWKIKDSIAREHGYDIEAFAAHLRNRKRSEGDRVVDLRALSRPGVTLRERRGVSMESEGVVHNGVIVPDDATVFAEGMRVRISPVAEEKPRPFGERFAQFKGAVPSLPADLAAQHDHYRLGTPKR